MDSCKFWIVSSGILYHSSSSCLGDDEGNLLLTLLSKTDHSGSIIFRLGECASQRRWSASSCSSNQDYTFLPVCMGELSSWNIASLLGNNTWPQDAPGYVNVHVVTDSNLTTQSKYRTSRILDIAAQIITDLAPCFTVGTRHSGLQAFLAEVRT